MEKEIGTPLRRLAGVSPLASRCAADRRAGQPVGFIYGFTAFAGKPPSPWYARVRDVAGAEWIEGQFEVPLVRSPPVSPASRHGLAAARQDPVETSAPAGMARDTCRRRAASCLLSASRLARSRRRRTRKRDAARSDGPRRVKPRQPRQPRAGAGAFPCLSSTEARSSLSAQDRAL
jgi:hypothetical protein